MFLVQTSRHDFLAYNFLNTKFLTLNFVSAVPTSFGQKGSRDPRTISDGRFSTPDKASPIMLPLPTYTTPSTLSGVFL